MALLSKSAKELLAKNFNAEYQRLGKDTTAKLEEKAQKEKSYEYITNAVQSGAPSSLTKKERTTSPLISLQLSSVGRTRFSFRYF